MADKITENDKNNILNIDTTIKINTITNTVKCIDAACQRGAFKGEEMSFVGNVRDSLNHIIQKETKKYIKNKSDEVALPKEHSLAAPKGVVEASSKGVVTLYPIDEE